MLAKLKRIVLVLLVCILPVQSAAAALLPVVCAPQETSPAAAGAHGGHDHAAHVHDEAAPQPGGAAHDHGGEGHLCCHQVSSGTPFVHVLPAPSDFRVYAATVAVLTPLHIPELPQRPPRS